jgi:LysM domain-containing protein
MRRTTICRSSLIPVPVALAAVLLGAPPLRAQDTTAAPPPTPAEAPPPGQVPASHVVQRGETLWSIAQLYYTDPLLWPEIYRQNTSVIEDPHWIYPGEVLNLAPVLAGQPAEQPTEVVVAPEAGDTIRAAPVDSGGDTLRAAPPDTLPPPDTTQAVVDVPPPPEPEPETPGYETIFGRRRQARTIGSLVGLGTEMYRPVRRGEFYSAGFLSERERLPFGNVIGATAPPAIATLSQSSSAQIYTEIAVRPPSGASYHVNDSLLVVRIDRSVSGWGDVIVPQGIARVTAVQERQILAQVVAQFGRVRDGHFTIPLEPFNDPGFVRPAPVENGLAGRVVDARDLHPLAGPQQIFFIDKGRSDGVVPGDIFEVFRPAEQRAGGASEQIIAWLLIVHTREKSASGLVLNLTHPDVSPRMPVRLVRKMPS